MAPFVSAVVLAAGMSRRMGTLKQLVRFGEHTLLEHTLNAVRASSIGETILVLGYQADQIRSGILLEDNVRVIINDNYKDGMSTSIRRGLEAVSPDANAALIILADQPFLKSSVIDQLIAQYGNSNAAILYPVYKGFRGNPVLVDRSLFPEMTQITGDIGCRSIFGLHSKKIRKVPVDDIGILVDIDTVEDLSNAIAQGEHSPQDIWAGLDLKGREERQKAEPDAGHLVIVGYGDVPRALAEIAKVLKFRVTIVDPLVATSRSNPPVADQVLDELNLSKVEVTLSTSIVVASRGKYDEEALDQALETPAEYIALVGSKKRGAEIVARLIAADTSEQAAKRIKFPAGLKINASAPEEIALSIMAQIISLKTQ